MTGVDSGSEPGVVLLAGDAGIGKTRLLTVLAVRARDHGWLVSVGQCLDLGSSPLPYLAVIEAFGRMESQSPAVEEALGSGYPYADSSPDTDSPVMPRWWPTRLTGLICSRRCMRP